MSREFPILPNVDENFDEIAPDLAQQFVVGIPHDSLFSTEELCAAFILEPELLDQLGLDTVRAELQRLLAFVVLVLRIHDTGSVASASLPTTIGHAANQRTGRFTHHRKRSIATRELRIEGLEIRLALDASSDAPECRALDFSGDGIVSPADVLGPINYLTEHGSQVVSEENARNDTNGDGHVSPIDVLVGINFLNDTAATMWQRTCVPDNGAPIAQFDNASTFEDNLVTVNVLQNDTDPRTSALAMSASGPTLTPANVDAVFANSIVADPRGAISFEPGDIQRRFGNLVGDTPLPGDFNGDHKTDFGVARNNTFLLDVTGDLQWNRGDKTFWFGNAVGDEPIVGDWDGNGRSEIGVHRGNLFFLDANGNGRWDSVAGGDRFHTFRNAGDLALVGDWDGDGDDDLGTWNGSYFYLDRNGNSVWDGAAAGDVRYTYGLTTDTPLAGDWNGDGADEIGVHRGFTFYLDASGNGVWNGKNGGDGLYAFGIPGDTPVVGDWNADGKDGIGVRRANVFYVDANDNKKWDGDVRPRVVQTPPPVTVPEDSIDQFLPVTAFGLSVLVVGNTNPELVTATLNGSTVRLAFADDRHGTAVVIVGATDAAGRTVTTSIPVTVESVNDPPASEPDTYSFFESLTVDATKGVLRNDADLIDAPGNALSAVLVTPPAHAATFTLESDGSFTYIAASLFTGADSFTYRPVDDGGTEQGGNNEGSITTVTLNGIIIADSDAIETTNHVNELLDVLHELSQAEIPTASRTVWPGNSDGTFLGRITRQRSPSGLLVSPNDGDSLVYVDRESLHIANIATGLDRAFLTPQGTHAIGPAAYLPLEGIVATAAGSNVVFSNSKTGNVVGTAVLTGNVSSMVTLGDAVAVSIEPKGVYRIDTNGTVSELLPFGNGLHLSSDGSIFAVSDQQVLHLYDADTLEHFRQINFGYNTSNSWSPYVYHRIAIDAAKDRIAISLGSDNGYSSRLWVETLRTGEHLGSMPLFHQNHVALIPDTDLLVTDGPDDPLRFFRFDGVRSWTEIASFEFSGLSDIASSSDGSVFYVAHSSGIDAMVTPGTNLDTGDPVVAKKRHDAVTEVLGLAQNVLSVTANSTDSANASTFASALLDRKQRLAEATRLLSLLSLDQLDRNLRRSAEDIFRDTALFRIALDADVERLLTVVNAIDAAEHVDSLTIARLLRERTIPIDLWAGNSAPEWYGNVQIFSLGATGILRIVSSGTPSAPFPARTTEHDRSLGLSAILTGIDVSSASAPVTGIRLSLSATGTTPEIIAFRDGLQLGIHRPDATGVVHVRDTEGITALLVRRDPVSAVTVHSLSLTTDALLPLKTVGALSPFTNRELALAVSPADWQTIAAPFHPANIFIDPDKYTKVSVSGYTKNAELAGISYYRAADRGNSFPLPDHFITKLSPTTWIIHPGAPTQLLVRVSGAQIFFRGESLGYEWEYEQKVTSALTAQELIPIGPMRITVGTLDVDVASSAGDFESVFLDRRPTEMPQHSHPRGTGPITFIMTLENVGADGGTFTLELFGVPSSYDPENVGAPQRSFDISIEPGGTKILSTWVDIPRSTETGFALARLTYPDGRQEFVQVAGTAYYRERSFVRRTWNPETHQIDSVTVANPYSEDDQHHIARALRRLAEHFASRGDSVTSKRILSGLPFALTGGADVDTIAPSVREDLRAIGIVIPESETPETSDAPATDLDTLKAASEDINESNGVDLDIDLGGSRDALTTAHLMYMDAYRRVLRHYDGRVMSLPFTLREGSQVGRLFLGLLQEVEGHRTSDSFERLIADISVVTAIPSTKLRDHIARGGDDLVSIAKELRWLFEHAGYRNTFIDPAPHSSLYAVTMPASEPTLALADRRFLSVHHHVEPGVQLTLRFDLVTGSTPVSYVHAYLLDNNGIVISRDSGGKEVPLYLPVYGLGVRIPHSVLAPLIQDDASRHFQVQLIAAFTSERVPDRPIPDIAAKTDGFIYTPESASAQGIIGEFSTQPPGPTHDLEQAILSQLAFPVASGVWTIGVESSFHHSAAIFALDLNSPNDLGKPVAVSAKGFIEKVNLDTGQVVLRHLLQDGTVWRTIHHHMTHILEDFTGYQYLGIKEADSLGIDPAIATQQRALAQAEINRLIASNEELDQGLQLGTVGTEGESTGSHLHFQVIVGNSTPVNLFRWADGMQSGITTSALVGTVALALKWNNETMSLFDDLQRIAVIRRDELDAAGNPTGVVMNTAYAGTPTFHAHEPETWQNIIWKVVREEDYPDGIARWRSLGDDSRFWNGTGWDHAILKP